MRQLCSICPRTGIFAFLFVFLAVLVQAQFKAGIQGTVTDLSGAVMPGAKVIVTSLETGKSQQIVTSGDGFYSITGLAPGRYNVIVERDGFKRQELENVIVSAEATQGVNVALEPGSISETMTVAADTTPAIQTENANMDRGITQAEIRELPQFGRDPYELLRLTPGVFGSGAQWNRRRSESAKYNRARRFQQLNFSN